MLLQPPTDRTRGVAGTLDAWGIDASERFFLFHRSLPLAHGNIRRFHCVSAVNFPADCRTGRCYQFS